MPELARQWLKRYPKVPLVNAYGPAECADDVSLWRIEEPPGAEAVSVPIGHPTDNNRLYVLDGELERVAVGVVGEVCVAGVGVGRGYLGDAARTAEAFVPHPYGAPGERLYRTGDLGASALGRSAGVRGPSRPAGEGAGLPHRARRDRSAAARRCPACERRRCWRERTRPAAASGSSPTWCSTRATRAARGDAAHRRARHHPEPQSSARQAAAGLHGADAVGGLARAAAERERQGGPQGPAGAGRGRHAARVRGARERGRARSGRDLAAAAARRARGARGRLLRARRRLDRGPAAREPRQARGPRARPTPRLRAPAARGARPGGDPRAAGLGARRRRWARRGAHGRARAARRCAAGLLDGDRDRGARYPAQQHRGHVPAQPDAAGHAGAHAARAGLRHVPDAGDLPLRPRGGPGARS